MPSRSPPPPASCPPPGSSCSVAADRTHSTQRVAEALLPHLRRAKDLIDRHYAEPLDLDALASTAHVSKYHFLRSFSATYGVTPAAYLTRRRIERAQDLLRASNLTVTEICGLVGYDSLGSFSSRFRTLVGVSPSAYQVRYAATGTPHIPGCFILMHGAVFPESPAIAEKPDAAPTP